MDTKTLSGFHYYKGITTTIDIQVCVNTSFHLVWMLARDYNVCHLASWMTVKLFSKVAVQTILHSHQQYMRISGDT